MGPMWQPVNFIFYLCSSAARVAAAPRPHASSLARLTDRARRPRYCSLPLPQLPDRARPLPWLPATRAAAWPGRGRRCSPALAPPLDPAVRCPCAAPWPRAAPAAAPGHAPLLGPDSGAAARRRLRRRLARPHALELDRHEPTRSPRFGGMRRTRIRGHIPIWVEPVLT